MKNAKKSQGSFNEYLPMIGCYRPLHSITTKEAINSYPANSDESKAFVNTQFNEVETEQGIKALSLIHI